jgi:hypothetical protein
MNNKYIALLWPLLGGIVMTVLQAYQAVTSEGVTPSEWVTVVIQGFTLLTVWLAANVPGFDRAKPFVAAVMVVLNLLVSLLIGGLDGNEITQLVVAFLATIGVFATPGPVYPVPVSPTVVR